MRLFRIILKKMVTGLFRHCWDKTADAFPFVARSMILYPCFRNARKEHVKTMFVSDLVTTSNVPPLWTSGFRRQLIHTTVRPTQYVEAFSVGKKLAWFRRPTQSCVSMEIISSKWINHRTIPYNKACVYRHVIMIQR